MLCRMLYMTQTEIRLLGNDNKCLVYASAADSDEFVRIIEIRLQYIEKGPVY
jgi:hypothetical protein